MRRFALAALAVLLPVAGLTAQPAARVVKPVSAHPPMVDESVRPAAALGTIFATADEPAAPIKTMPATSARPIVTTAPSYGGSMTSQLTGNSAVNECLTCCPHNECTWIRAEYLNWRATEGRLPPLVTTSPAGTPVGQAGLLGAPGTQVLFGGDKYLDDGRSGFRISTGRWLNESKTFGVEANFTFLAGDTASFAIASNGNPIVASSPFVDASSGAAQRVLIAFPGIVSGSTSVDYEASHLFAFEVLARKQLWCGDGWRLDGLAGYRHINYEEKLTIRKTLAPDPNGPIAVPAGTLITCDDTWEAETKFHGLALGFDLEKCCGCWSFTARPKVTLGQAKTSVDRDGVTTISSPGAVTQVLPGGTYNLVSNIGQTTTRRWTVVPELDLQVSRKFGDHWRAFAGYSLLYLPVAARAGDQIDSRVNQNFIPPVQPSTGPLLPGSFVNRDSILFMGISLGVEYRF